MNRDAHQGRVEQSSSGAGAAVPAAGKQTLAQHGAPPAGWSPLLASLEVTPAGSSEMSGASPREQTAAAPLMIQRQESPATDVEATADPGSLRADLEQAGREADALLMGIEMHRASAAFSIAEGGAFYQERLREVTGRVEALRPDVQASGVAELMTLLTGVQDRLVAGYQRLAVTHADESLQAWSNSTDEAQQLAQRQRWGQESGDKEGDWCGIFVNAQYRASGMHPAFAAAFNHTDNVAQFFSYVDGSRTPTEIIPAGATAEVELRAYHEQRGSLRSWETGAGIGDDIRPGDVLTVDWGSDDNAAANHTCIVSSYTPASGGQGATVVTIDGNAFGVRKPGSQTPAFDGTDMTSLQLESGTAGNNHRDLSISAWQAAPPVEGEAAAPAYTRAGSTQGEQLLTIVGRGRPSVVDFEPAHQYPDAIGLADPTIELTAPLQRSETGPARTKDPARAFAAAASGSFSEIPYRAEMEGRFGADFSAVQSFAGRGLDDLGALAATRGEQVVFASGSPDRQTVAHELTHVLQSRQGLTSGGKAMSDPGDASEHEARKVAAWLQGPESGQRKAPTSSIDAAPSGAIHRQENPAAPHPPHLDNTEGQARPINWDAADGVGTWLTFPEELAGSPTARDVYNFYLLRNLGLELPAQVTAYSAAEGAAAIPVESLSAEEGAGPRAAAANGLLAFLNTQMAELRRDGGDAAADAIRVPLFRASQQALVRTLNVESSYRYQQERDKKGNVTATFCNVFAYDMVTAMGAYLPRVWWRDPQAAIADPTLDANPNNTMQMNANALYQWMLDWGPSFGWRSVGTPADAQAEANDGKIAIILAGLGVVDQTAPGHVSVVMAESSALGVEGRGDGIPLQAQAGAVNYSNSSLVDDAGDGAADTATGPWWETFPEAALPALAEGETRPADMSLWAEYAQGHGFFVYEGGGRGQVSIRTPQETGLVLPEAAAPAAEATETAGS
jgi:Domain of unknown function (DUF4157)